MKIGNIEIDKPLVLAPMESVTDQAFRIICKRFGADIVFTEFVSSEGLIRDCRKAMRKMEFDQEERPIGIQIYGSNETSMEKSAQIAESMQPDFIDINCGCWVKNVVNTGAGSALLKDLKKLEKILVSVIKSTRLPITIKTRLGWDKNSINIVEVAKIAEQCGVSAITIHCRTRDQQMKGEPDYSWLALVKSSVFIPVIANGSFDTPEKIKHAFEKFGVDGVMIGRGAIGKPWIFLQTKDYLNGKIYKQNMELQNRFRAIREHLELSVKIKGEPKGVIEFRKYISGYLSGLYDASRIRAELMNYKELHPILKRLDEYEEFLLERAEVGKII